MQPESGRSATNAAAPVQPAITITSRQRDPPFFAGLRGEDVEEWLEQYDRVSSFNCWDDTFKLRNVDLYLSEVARTWFRNHRDGISDWTDFTRQLRQIFGTSSARAAGAKKKLDARIQHPDETYVAYIEDVVSLCRRVDQDMSEADKLRHIMKGIAPFAFNALATQNPTTIAEVRAICLRLDDLQSIRLQQDAWPTSPSGNAELRALIRSIIREELQHREAPYPHNAQVNAHGLRDVIKEELASMTNIPQPCQSAQSPIQSYSEVASRPAVPVQHFVHPHAPGHLTALSAPSTPPPYFSAWRAMRPPDDRPVCFYCGIRGHISRFCRRRQLDERRGYAPFERDNRFNYAPRLRVHSPPPDRFSPSPDSDDRHRTPRSARRRSPSPFRQSSSPLRPASQAFNRHQEN